MSKMRVHELAKELKITSKETLALLQGMGEFVKSPSSMVEEPIAERLRRRVGVHSKRHQLQPQPSRTEPEGTGGPVTTPATVAKTSSVATPRISNTSGWHAGAVPAPQHRNLLASIDRLGRKFPIFQAHLEAFQKLGSQVVYAGMCSQQGFRDCAVAHVRFSGAIENGFGFTRQVALFYSPHSDLQSRTFKAATRELKAGGQSVTPDVFFMSSPDERLKMKLRDWSDASAVAIPLDINEDDEFSLITLLRDHIYARDLFYETTPVHGASFFGRRTLIQSLRHDVFKQSVTGIFGLRKSGKTSILMQLKEELKEDNIVTVLMDLETFPSPPEDPTDDIVDELRKRLVLELKAAGLRTKELSELGSRPTILSFKEALQTILRRIGTDGNRVLLLLDEIEYLTPSDRVDIAEGELPRIAQFISALRSIVQESDNFTFVLSGLTSAIVENGRLYGRPNPLFSWAKAVYVSPLNREEADDLASTVGSKMGVQIEPGALAALHEASGGHAFLYRSLSSAVVGNLPKNDFQRTMTGASVQRQLADWKSRVQGNINEMIEHVSRYYSTEAVMLELLMESPNDFAEIASTEPVAVRRLRDLGLIYETTDGYGVSVVLELR